MRVSTVKQIAAKWIHARTEELVDDGVVLVVPLRAKVSIDERLAVITVDISTFSSEGSVAAGSGDGP